MKTASHSSPHLHFVAKGGKRPAADALVVPFWKGKKHPEQASEKTFHFPVIDLTLESDDFKGVEGELLTVYLTGEPEKRVILLGLGDKSKVSLETLRRAYAALTKICRQKRYTSINIALPKVSSLSEHENAKAVAEGLLLINYHFSKYKTKALENSLEPAFLKNVSFLGLHHGAGETAVKEVQKVCEGVYLARDLVNDNADFVTPRHLAEVAKQLAKDYPKLKTTVFDKKRIEKEKMGLLLAVNRGSAVEPYFLIIEYKGDPKSKDHTVVVGKGITYDTGGLNIKTSNMETMKCDMGGAATCLGLMKVLGELKPKVNVTAVIPTTDNAVDAHSYKPGDVYPSYSGKFVEMTNTDAEGRLILADALSYASRNLKPTRLISFATLTGAIDIALGSEATGLMVTDDKFAEKLIAAGEASGERAWRMPLFDDYRDRLKSEIADIKSWNGRAAGASVAAIFLKEFVENAPWAHFDIASTAYIPEAKRYLPKHGTGVGVRLMIEFLNKV